MNASVAVNVVGSELNQRIVQLAYQALYKVMRLFCGRIHGDVLTQLVQRVLIDLAVETIQEEQAQSAGDSVKNKVTLTEIGLRTGIDTRVIRRLQAKPMEFSEEDLYPEAAVLKRWQKDPSLLNQLTQKPKELVVYGRGGTFQGLVLSVLGRGISATAVLERLQASGHVQIVRQHHVRLLNGEWQGVSEPLVQTLEHTVEALVHELPELGQHSPGSHSERACPAPNQAAYKRSALKEGFPKHMQNRPTQGTSTTAPLN